jgi:hypothetical protein
MPKAIIVLNAFQIKSLCLPLIFAWSDHPAPLVLIRQKEFILKTILAKSAPSIQFMMDQNALNARQRNSHQRIKINA